MNEYPRPWRVDERFGLPLDANGKPVPSADSAPYEWAEYILPALVGAVNAADASKPLPEVLADLAAGKVGA